MIEFLKTNETGLERLSQAERGCWIRVTGPTEGDIRFLNEDIGIPAQFISYSRDEDELAKIDRIGEAMLLIIDIPHRIPVPGEEPYTTRILGIILIHEYIVTICNYPTKVLEELVGNYANRFSTVKRHQFILYILMAMANKYLSCLNRINHILDETERLTRVRMKNENLMEMYRLQKSLTYFTVGLRSNQILMQRLHKAQLFQKFPEDLALFEDVIAEINQASEMTSIAADILQKMMEAFSYMIANSLNSVIKFLTSLTILLAIPTLVASVYGMNVPLPFAGVPYAFFIVMGVTVTLSAVVSVYFWKRRWF
jgi:magnesium transporter